jgi:hypothetical protein
MVELLPSMYTIYYRVKLTENDPQMQTIIFILVILVGHTYILDVIVGTYAFIVCVYAFFVCMYECMFACVII